VNYSMRTSLMMPGLFVLMSFACIPVNALDCEVIASIPGNSVEVSNGVATDTSNFSGRFLGGQIAMIKIKNNAIHFASATVTISSVCQKVVTLQPQQTAIVQGTSFSNIPIAYEVSVASNIGDAVQLLINVFTPPPPFNLSGQWKDLNGRIVVVNQPNYRLTCRDFQGTVFSGKVNGTSSIKVEFTGACCTGSISSDQRTISWSNGTSWRKQ